MPIKNVTAEDLDSIVHDAASSLASNANNGGVDEQVNFLVTTCGYTLTEIGKLVGKPIVIHRYP